MDVCENRFVKPLVLLPCDVKQVGLHPFHCVGEKYINAVAHGADTWPLLVPAFGAGADLRSLSDHVDLDVLLSGVDGVFLPGSVSNVHPGEYGAGADPDMQVDPQRDALALSLIRRAIALGVPLLAVCRGIQELNVALGGTLHPSVHGLPGMMDHREDKAVGREAQYAHSHHVTLRQGGTLQVLLGESRIQVNSLHGQGVRDLAPGLLAEATAPDGLVEAVSMPAAAGFVLGVQWHPEWAWRDDPNSANLFRAFGEAARVRLQVRRGG